MIGWVFIKKIGMLGGTKAIVKDIAKYLPGTKNGEVKKYANTEHALCVLNHRGDLDWMIGWVFIERIGMLGGTKAIMKDIAKYLPGIGWTFMFMEYPFLKRDWKRDEKRLAESCKNLKDYPVNMLLCLFAEGTRFTPEKHEVSQEFARSRGLPILKHHLMPRTKGFNFILKHMDGVFPCIYDITICYRDNKEPTLMGVVNAEPCRADMMVRRYPVSDIDTSSEEAMHVQLAGRPLQGQGQAGGVPHEARPVP